MSGASREGIIIHIDVSIVLLYFFILVSEKRHANVFTATCLFVNRMLREDRKLAATSASLKLLGGDKKLSWSHIPTFQGNRFHLIISRDNRRSRYSL